MNNEQKQHAEVVSDAADRARGWGVCHACKVRRPISAFKELEGGVKLQCTDGCTQEPPQNAKSIKRMTLADLEEKLKEPQMHGGMYYCALCEELKFPSDLKEVTISESRRRFVCSDANAVACVDRHDAKRTARQVAALNSWPQGAVEAKELKTSSGMSARVEVDSRGTTVVSEDVLHRLLKKSEDVRLQRDGDGLYWLVLRAEMGSAMLRLDPPQKGIVKDVLDSMLDEVLPPVQPDAFDEKSVSGVTFFNTDSAKDTGIKYDQGKSRLDLVPMRALVEVGHVLAKGAERYGPNNWRKVIGWRWRYTGAALRHVAAYLTGKRVDDEGKHPTMRHHLACALCSLLFVLENDLHADEGGEVVDGDAR